MVHGDRNAVTSTVVLSMVKEERLHRCHHDLADPGLSHLAVAEIAARWGYRSPAHFSRAFTARFGHPPGQARRAGL
jgi:transcriptional regulator GlxA family with amidase domain